MRKFVFSISSGRAGSKYLSTLLDTAANASAFHEPYPDMAGCRVSMFPATHKTLLNSLLYLPVYAAKYTKVRAIKKTLQTLPADHIYIETNHMFITSFYDAVMNHFKQNLDVILLRRYLPKVVKSFVDLDLFGNSPHTKTWTTPADSPSAVIRPPIAADQMDQFDKCITFLIDIEARAQRFRQQYPQTPVVEVRLEELNNWQGVENLFSALGLEPTNETREMVGNIVNKRDKRKSEQNQLNTDKKAVTEEYCLERIMEYIDKCKMAGSELPELPQLEKI
jgi:hypothetical protein